MEIEDGHFNVFIPVRSVKELYAEAMMLGSDGVQNLRSGHFDDVHPAVTEWLYKNVGPRRAYGREWYHADALGRRHDWSVRGELYLPDRAVIQVMIRDRRAAQLFKMAFGVR